ncbi:MAG: AIR synthase-related protein, partial [Candidatus Thorarchaeota archaeon]
VELEDCRKVAFATSSNSFWCQLDPQTGTANSAALALRNLVSTGATPLFIADCLNVGNPERPESYAEFVEAAKGLGRFSHDFDIPVVTGNVSPYNERIVDGVSNRIKPTSQVLLGGVLPRDRPPIRRTLCTPWANIYLIGETYRELNGTEFQRYQLQESRGLPPEYQPQSEKRAMDAVLKTQKQGLVRSCNNVGRGGLSIALMKMVMKSEYGFTLDLRDIPGTAGSITEALYSESSARYLMEVTESNQEAFLRIVRESGAAATELGLTVNERIANFGEFSLSIEAARESFKRGLAQQL